MLECLQDLDRSLRERDSRLIVVDEQPERAIVGICRLLGARTVHASADVGPFASRRDGAVRTALAEAGVELLLHPGLFTVDDPTALRTRDGRPYTVFTPYFRNWSGAPRRDVHELPGELPPLPPGRRAGRIPQLRELGLSQLLSSPVRGGERPARAVLEEFLTHGVQLYGEQRDVLGAGGSSSLSPYLHFGCVSPREIEARLPPGSGSEAFARQLCWREFYAQVLDAFPANTRSEHQERYRGTVRWRDSTDLFDAWREGRTGYPIVDASMRQLLREGWIHNRGRLIVGSFLTKDLGIDWRWGERWFMETLLDGDEASNNGNWQWIASVGVDPQPPSRRIFNPMRQQQRFDPEGSYVRRHVPELRRVPDEYLAEPWTMPTAAQHAAGCVIGRDYPEPIIDHAQARREALERYASASRSALEGRDGD